MFRVDNLDLIFSMHFGIDAEIRPFRIPFVMVERVRL